MRPMKRDVIYGKYSTKLQKNSPRLIPTPNNKLDENNYKIETGL